jgi:hypothetical protein
MPRARRTKSAVHEALQRRAGQRPGASFSVKLDAPPPAWRPPLRFHTGCFALATLQHTGEHGDTRDSRLMCRTHFTTLFAMRSPSGVFCCNISPAGPRLRRRRGTDLPPSPVTVAGEVSADASPTALRGVITATVCPATPRQNVATAADFANCPARGE